MLKFMESDNLETNKKLNYQQIGSGFKPLCLPVGVSIP